MARIEVKDRNCPPPLYTPADGDYTPSAQCAPTGMETAAVKVGERLTQDPFRFMPDVLGNVKRSLARILGKKRAPAALRKDSFSLHWEDADAKKVADALFVSQNFRARAAFLRFISAPAAENAAFTASVFTYLVSQNHPDTPAGLLADLQSPVRGSAILFAMDNPATAARVLRRWECRGNLYTANDYFNALRKLNAMDPAWQDKYRRLMMFAEGGTLSNDGSNYCNPAEDKVLRHFDGYNRSDKSEEARKKLRMNLDQEKRREILSEDCIIGYKSDGETERVNGYETQATGN